MKYFIAVIIFLAACAEVPGQVFTGTLKGSSTIRLPITGKKVCVGGVSWSELREKEKIPLNKPAELRFADDATLLFKGESLKIVGRQSDGIYHSSMPWRWSKYKDEIPKNLWGWGNDATLKMIGDEILSRPYVRVTATEEFAECGNVVSLDAIREGNTLRLVDNKPVERQNAATKTYVIWGVFSLVTLMLLGLLIRFFVGRSRRKKDMNF